MAVFSTNLVIYKHTDFEQTFALEDSQSNSVKDLTDFSGKTIFDYADSSRNLLIKKMVKTLDVSN